MNYDRGPIEGGHDERASIPRERDKGTTFLTRTIPILYLFIQMYFSYVMEHVLWGFPPTTYCCPLRLQLRPPPPLPTGTNAPATASDPPPPQQGDDVDDVMMISNINVSTLQSEIPPLTCAGPSTSYRT